MILRDRFQSSFATSKRHMGAIWLQEQKVLLKECLRHLFLLWEFSSSNKYPLVQFFIYFHDSYSGCSFTFRAVLPELVMLLCASGVEIRECLSIRIWEFLSILLVKYLPECHQNYKVGLQSFISFTNSLVFHLFG